MDTPIFGHKHYNTAGHAHELTFSCYRRLPYFEDKIACRIFLDSVRKAKYKFNFQLWAYVIMPNHVHLLIWPSENPYDIGKIIQAINGTMSRRFSRLLSRINPEYHTGFLERKKDKQIFRFWQRGGGFDRNLFNPDSVYASIGYIENNPVKKNIVSHANEYIWSSAWLSDGSEKWRPELDRKSLPVKMIE